MTISVRLKPETRKLLDRMARSERVSRSELVRRSIEALARQQNDAADGHPYETVKDLIGRARGGRSDLSERTGARFRDLLSRKKGPPR